MTMATRRSVARRQRKEPTLQQGLQQLVESDPMIGVRKSQIDPRIKVSLPSTLPLHTEWTRYGAAGHGTMKLWNWQDHTSTSLIKSKGPPISVSYVVMVGGRKVGELCYFLRDYPRSTHLINLDKAGTFTVHVHRDYRDNGIATALYLCASEEYDIDLIGQHYTPQGAAWASRILRGDTHRAMRSFSHFMSRHPVTDVIR